MRYIDPTLLHPGYLDVDTPLGLFREIDHNQQIAFFVTHNNSRKFAIILSHPQTNSAFFAIPLEEGSKTFSGVSILNCQIQVDLETARGLRHGPGPLGTVGTREGKLSIFARPESNGPFPGSITRFDVSDAPGIGEAGCYYTRWRIVQVNEHGELQTLFEYDADAGGVA